MRTWLWLCVMASAVASPAASGQEPVAARDPTQWPPALRAAVAAQATPAASAPDAIAVAPVRQVIMADGRAYVVQRGRRYAVGESLDGARIERITEHAVWFREAAGTLRRESLYGGVEKRAPALSPSPAASGIKKSKEKP
ncbi:hypothetical protein NYO99_05030 [Pelomonas sp. UHG3]|jgi:hypothetical protein|uniref:Uncharacterized protein n=1 Tax=Roseateles hydrophilus TaxID=2975054 RepID=A0ACC6C7C2_9BURK|nr:hypothetical protein [Pelomonas sp. UHG3]MCY4744328.1 hypothetical protein [Pelomonas sp. UHG3]